MYDALSMEFITWWDFVVPEFDLITSWSCRPLPSNSDRLIAAPLMLSWFSVKSEEIDSPEKNLDFPAKQRKICVKDPTPKELVAVSD
ncbi:hypothetical protein Pint_21313 [Pistacia integerrima]|uniref:Uncharacterized protein n=1 Tax=Pistacia integerrima TaxID=434235 RepID=A0ACC0XDE0_9ROSI|nr:hypothetical protein Pint_21313 [Pistacia integerrima]